MTTPAGPSSLTERTSRAAIWATIQAFVLRLGSLVTHFVLARILLEEDFGLYALAMTVCTLATFMHQGGIQDVLVKRQRKFYVWANAAFWLVTFLGCASALATMAVAPLIAAFFKVERSDELVWLIVVAACVFPLTAGGAVCRARMLIEMRFKDLARIAAIHMTLDATFKIVFAIAGFGAMSFAYGAVAATAFHLGLCWYYAPVPVKWNPQIRRWRYLMNDGMLVISAHFFNWCVDEGDYFVLGRFEPVGVVGVYFLAYRIARHSMQTLTLQLGRVLFPALASIPLDRQVPAFVRAGRVMAAVSMPLCFLVALFAEPIVTLLFEPRWYDAILLIQIMCVGMALRTLSFPSWSLQKAQGRFRLRLIIAVVSVLLFFPLAIVGTSWGSAIGLAISVGIFHSSMAVVDLLAALAPGGRPWHSLGRIVSVPLAANVISVLAGGTIVYGLVPPWQLSVHVQSVVQLGLGGIVAVTAYVLSLRLLDDALWQELRNRFNQLLPGGRGASATST